LCLPKLFITLFLINIQNIIKCRNLKCFFLLFQIVQLASEVFNYSAIDRAKAKTKKTIQDKIPQIGRHFHRIGLPPKVSKLESSIKLQNGTDTIRVSQFTVT